MFRSGCARRAAKTIGERMNDEIRARLKRADQLDQDERLKASVEAMMPIYSYDIRASRLQAEGIYPAAFATIKVPILMVHGIFDPHPGRLIFAGLRSYLPQLQTAGSPPPGDL
jgi:pimeloyl-ACP methyl ester carboxylesterase